MIQQGSQVYPDLQGKQIMHHKINTQNDQNFFEKYVKLSNILTPPSLRTFEIISIYSTMLWAVSRKKQVTTASQTPAH